MTSRNTILIGDALTRLRELPDGCIDCVVTSPPYFLLRTYGDAKDQLGLEPNVETWVANLRAVMTEVRRVTTPGASVWLNLGDSYSRHPKYGAPTKGLLLAPERLLLALAADGFIVRNKAIWSKTNPMPTSVTDRLTNTYDVVYHLVKQRLYHYDLDAIRIEHTTTQSRPASPSSGKRPEWAGPLAGSNSGLHRPRPGGIPGSIRGRNPGDVWRLPTASYKGAHFATFPSGLVERPLLATCPLRVCTKCNVPWRHGPGKVFVLGKRMPAGRDKHVRRYPGRWQVLRQPGPIGPDCDCVAPGRPGLVLDPFFGTGTVGQVAERHGRDWLGIELNSAYADLAWQRLGRTALESKELAA
jgi:DNA modification methylase